MLRSRTTIKDNTLSVIIDGFKLTEHKNETADFLTTDIIGMDGGKATDEGIFREARFRDQYGGACGSPLTTELTATYGQSRYDLKLQTYIKSVELTASKQSGSELPDGLPKKVRNTLRTYVRQKNKGGY